MVGTKHDSWLEELKAKELGVVTRRVTDADAWYLLTSAFEGGSNYWARINNSKPFFPNGREAEYIYIQDVPFLPGGKVIIEQLDDDEYEPCPFPLTRERLLQAFQMMADKTPHQWHSILNGSADADTGDVFLQYAVLGEIKYG